MSLSTNRKVNTFNTITITAAFERFFSDRFKNYDTFFGTFFRGKGSNDLIPVDRSSKPFKIKVSDIKVYLQKEKEINDKKIIWAEILDDISLSRNVSKLASIIEYNPVSLSQTISNGVISNKLLEQLEKNLTIIEKKLEINFLKYQEHFKD